MSDVGADGSRSSRIARAKIDEALLDDASADAPKSLDLTPTEVVPSAKGKTRRTLPTVLLLGVMALLGFVLVRSLGDAALFFYNADEAVEQRDELEGRRFRVQGTPFGEPVTTEIERDGKLDVGVAFPIKFEGSIIDVVHTGNPAELFQPGVPVVLEGTWSRGLPTGVDPILGGAGDGWHFASSDMVVKHDNEYRDDNRERLDEANLGGIAPEA